MRIDTERLVLRRWRTDDVAPLAAIMAQPAVARWLGEWTDDDAHAAVERWEHSWETLGFGRFAVEERATGALVGRAGIMRAAAWPATPEKDEVGWALDPSRWGLGYATEAATVAIADGFARVGLPRIVSFTLPENVASRRVMERCGMTERGTAVWGGLPHVWFDITASASGGGSPADR